MGAKRIGRGWFHNGESGFPAPQRQAQAPREISSKVPSMIEGFARAQNFAGRERGAFAFRGVDQQAPASPVRA